MMNEKMCKEIKGSLTKVQEAMDRAIKKACHHVHEGSGVPKIHAH